MFASELKSIFGRIKNKALELRVKFTKSGTEDSSVNSSLVNTPATASRVDKDSLALSQDRSKSTARDRDHEIDHEDPLKGLAMDLSSEVSAEETLRMKPTTDDQSEAPANLDSTIIIGDIEEGNIFDNFDVKSQREGEDENNESQPDDKKLLKISMEELQDVMNDVRIKHRAELDAVMLEQAAYKRIIKGIVLKLKEQ